MTEYVNLTKHDVVIYPNGPATITIRPSGTVARIRESVLSRSSNGDVDFVSVDISETKISGLPEPKDGVVYIVSMPTAMTLRRTRNRDIVYPYDPVLDERGRIIGCRSLAHVSDPTFWF
jgi:hypothetical protein